MFSAVAKIGLTSILLASATLQAQQTSPLASAHQPGVDAATLQKLLDRLAADETRIRELENRLARQETLAPEKTISAPESSATGGTQTTMSAPQTAVSSTPATPEIPEESGNPHDHMEMPGGGPNLKIRGFVDLNAGLGSSANPLQFPINAPSHASFQLGQLDLFISSKLSDRLSFISEVAIGSDASNAWGLDIERLQLTYRPSDFFEISAGRYHTAIGYYNTAFHHGAWFQTATGRPIMYHFEDNNGLLPVHSVGVSMSGLVPGTSKLGLHWIAETTNGRTSDTFKEPVQNFLADRDSKGYNLAAYIAPQWAHGLQIGGSSYHDLLTPTGIPHVHQDISSLYAVYITPTWEFLNEGVLLNNRLGGSDRIYRTPMAYSQISRKFGSYRPYFRYQYINSPANDPINVYTGRVMGPSVGLRWDVFDYAALKLQFNRFDQRTLKPANGLDAQMAFTF